MEGVPVVPIQAITCCVSVAAGLAGILMFLEGAIGAAFAVSSLVCYTWRIFSETLRADHRGGGRVSKYQWIAASVVYSTVILFVLPMHSIGPDVSNGLRTFWDP